MPLYNFVSVLKSIHAVYVRPPISPAINRFHSVTFQPCNNRNLNQKNVSQTNSLLTTNTPLVLIGRHFKPRRMMWPIDHLPFQWTRPQKTPSIFNSGDNQGPPVLDLSQPKGNFKLSTELLDAKDDVKKVFSLEFATNQERNQDAREQFVARVRRHPLDNDSEEVVITRMTFQIRILQEHMRRNLGDKRQKVRLHNMILKRNKKLKLLSRAHYERFEWILKELDITYSPPPPGEMPTRITRKGELRRLTKEYCDGIRQKRLLLYHEKLKQQQQAFLEERERFLKSLTSGQ